jgi:hypothetical protein
LKKCPDLKTLRKELYPWFREADHVDVGEVGEAPDLRDITQITIRITTITPEEGEGEGAFENNSGHSTSSPVIYSGRIVLRRDSFT